MKTHISGISQLLGLAELEPFYMARTIISYCVFDHSNPTTTDIEILLI